MNEWQQKQAKFDQLPIDVEAINASLLEELYRNNKADPGLVDIRSDFIKAMFLRGFDRSQSSTMCWSLYFACQFGVDINFEKAQWRRLFELGDGTTLTMIFYFLRIKGSSKKFSRFMNNEFSRMKAFQLDQMWLLRYQNVF